MGKKYLHSHNENNLYEHFDISLYYAPDSSGSFCF